MAKFKLKPFVPPHTQHLLNNPAPSPRLAPDNSGPRVHRAITGRPRTRMRRLLFAENPLCCMCQREGITRQWDELDHIVPLHLGGSDDRSNLQGLCIDHHREKSARESRELNSYPRGTGGGTDLARETSGPAPSLPAAHQKQQAAEQISATKPRKSRDGDA